MRSEQNFGPDFQHLLFVAALGFLLTIARDCQRRKRLIDNSRITNTVLRLARGLNNLIDHYGTKIVEICYNPNVFNLRLIVTIKNSNTINFYSSQIYLRIWIAQPAHFLGNITAFSKVNLN